MSLLQMSTSNWGLKHLCRKKKAEDLPAGVVCAMTGLEAKHNSSMCLLW